jgi:hypothetical protein
MMDEKYIRYISFEASTAVGGVPNISYEASNFMEDE